MSRQAAKEIDISIARNNADYRLLVTSAKVAKDEVGSVWCHTLLLVALDGHD